MRNSLQNTTNYKKATNTEKLVLVRTNILYGLKFEEIKQEKTSYSSGITSIPTFVFFNNNTQCFLDFTNSTNKDIESKVISFFTKIPVGTTINIYNASYYDSNKDERGDLSGEFTLAEYFNGIVKLNVTSVTDLVSNLSRYDKKYFEEIPLVITNIIQSSDSLKVTLIRNVFGSNTKNSFNHMGAKVGDYIALSNLDIKYEILEIFTDPNGIETVKVKGSIPSENLIDTKVMISLYITVSDTSYIEPSLLETELGSCTETSNGIVISCTDNHTLSQCRLRAKKINNTTATLRLNQFCTTPETDTAVELSTTDQLVQITNLLASNIAVANSSISNIAGPVNKNGNSKNSFYGR